MKASMSGRARAGIAGAVTVMVSVLAACGSSSPGSSSTPASAAAGSGGGGGSTVACGTNVPVPPSNPAGIYATLPKDVQARYQNWPFPLNASPWASTRKVKGPWKIGFISFAFGTPWQFHLLAEVKTMFAKAKAAGLVTGTLQTYIQPSNSTATPEQQIAAIQQMVREGINGILLLPLSGPAEAPAIDAAGKAGVPVVLMDNVIPTSKYAIDVWSQNQTTADSGTLGLIKKGNVLVVRGIAGQPSEQIFQNQAIKDIGDCPGIKIAGTVWGNWDATTAKTAVLQFLVSHPQKIDGVIQNGEMVPGIVQAFQQAGRPVPPISDGGCQGGELSWWLAHKSSYQTVGMCFNGYQTGFTVFSTMLRVLNGNGLKVSGIDIIPPTVTNANLAEFATPNEPLTWSGEPRGAIGGSTGWGSDSYLDSYFKVSGTPGGL
jgi:ribose transport system substrate-binding protein